MSSSGDTSQKSGGNYRKRILHEDRIGIQHFDNPLNFFRLFMSGDEYLLHWCIRNGLIARSINCYKEGCGGHMKIGKRSSRPIGASFRCLLDRNHECSVMKNTFFEGSHLDIRDVFQYTYQYLQGKTLLSVAKSTGVSYGGTAGDWGCFHRELFKEYFHKNIKQKKLSGIIEIDESLFGRKTKYHRGNPNKGLKVWVFGMVERESNTIILYPVCDRTTKTLVPIIERHVEKGSKIYSDGFSSYFHLNEIGYQHFTVLHKYAFKKSYKNTTTGGIEHVHTNRIEGAWKHAKDYFRKMSGTNATQWEGHMAEIIWRSHVKGQVYESFYDLLRTVYTLTNPPSYTYSTPLFDTWEGFEERDTVEPSITDAESADSEVSDTQSPSDIEESQSILQPAPGPSRPKRVTEKRMLISELLESSDDDDELNSTLTNTPLKVHKTQNVRCPAGFHQMKVEHKKEPKRCANEYTKDNYISLISSDEDFVESVPIIKKKKLSKIKKSKK